MTTKTCEKRINKSVNINIKHKYIHLDVNTKHKSITYRMNMLFGLKDFLSKSLHL